MSADSRYWDSDCFLAFFKEEADRVDLCRSVIRRAEAGEILLVTSALTLAEVLNLKGQPPLPHNIRQLVTDFFKNDYIHVRNVTRRVAESARELVWDAKIDPKDAIHVATALEARLPLLNTFDGKLLSQNGLVGDPPLIIAHPETTPQGELGLEGPHDKA